VLPAFTCAGYIALDIVEGSVTKEKFITFLEEQLVCIEFLFQYVLNAFLQAPKLNPYPGPNSVVVLDNCAIHHDEEIRRIIVDECGTLLTSQQSFEADIHS